jgi:RHS repeat-associated protein
VSGYVHDGMGSFIADSGKGLNLVNNFLNLPSTMSFADGSLNMKYSTSGEKLQKLSNSNEDGQTIIDYCRGIEYEDGQLSAIHHSCGRVIPDEGTGSAYRYQFYLTDHLGNVRMLFEDKDQNGSLINPKAFPYSLILDDDEIIEISHYYPFGLEMGVPDDNAWEKGVNGRENDYLYNGKELNGELGLDWMDFGFRWYDPAIGRFTGVDPLADHPNQVDKSPYAYAWNNPVYYTDPDGRCPQCAIGFAIGFGLDVASQMLFEGKSLSEVNYATAAVSGIAGAVSGGISSIAKLGKGAQLAVSATIDASESIGKQVVSGDDISAGQVVSDVVMGGIGGQTKVFDNANIKVKENALDRTQRIAKNDPTSSGRAQNVTNAQKSLNASNNINNAAATAVSNTLQTGSDNVRSFLNVDGGSGSYIMPQVQMAQDNTRVVLPIIVPKLKE